MAFLLETGDFEYYFDVLDFVSGPAPGVSIQSGAAECPLPSDETDECAEAYVEKKLPVDYSGNALIRYGNGYESGESQVLLDGVVVSSTNAPDARPLVLAIGVITAAGTIDEYLAAHAREWEGSCRMLLAGAEVHREPYAFHFADGVVHMLNVEAPYLLRDCRAAASRRSVPLRRESPMPWLSMMCSASGKFRLA